jgi:uncharacterized protein with PQ loop repeat
MKKFEVLYWQTFFAATVFQAAGIIMECMNRHETGFYFGSGVWFTGIAMMVYMVLIFIIIDRSVKYEE